MLVVGASTGVFGAVWAQAEVRKVLGAIGAEVVDRELPVMQAHAQFDEYGNLHEEDLRSQLAEHVAALVEATSNKKVAGLEDDGAVLVDENPILEMRR